MQSKVKEIKLASLELCTGCAACHDVCPTSSISMVLAQDGFYYPNIDIQSCIQCEKCTNTCYIVQERIIPITYKLIKPKTYFAWNSNLNESRKSTSGGLSANFVENYLNNGGFVCGVAFDDRFNLHNILTNDSIESKKLIGSKYLQSSSIGIFKKVKSKLESNNSVLFFGTPCQIEGLKSYLGNKLYTNLITCGILCHGVNSPEIWKRYVEYIEQLNKSKLIEYNFRDKSNGWNKLTVSMTFETGKKTITRARNNLFHYWFGQHYILRMSCSSCKFRTRERESDLVIGDFWGIEKIKPEIDTTNGISFLMINTERGMNFVESCKGLIKEEVDYMKSTSVLKGMLINKPLPEKRSDFLRDFNTLRFDQIARKYKAPNFFQYIFIILKSIIRKKLTIN